MMSYYIDVPFIARIKAAEFEELVAEAELVIGSAFDVDVTKRRAAESVKSPLAAIRSELLNYYRDALTGDTE